jgi:hypothetical protein
VDNRIVLQGDAHNGLVDAKLEAECLGRILYGKSLFEEFHSFKIPSYLAKV